MAVKQVVEYPNPILRQNTNSVLKADERIRRLVTDLTDTLRAFPGCVGLAANQIGESDRVAVVDVSGKDPAAKPLILINPKIIESVGEKFLREGCLSVQNLTANVKRFNEVTVQFQNLDGSTVNYRAQGIEAICIQHEIDHLNGSLFIDRVLNAQTDIFRRKKYLH